MHFVTDAANRISPARPSRFCRGVITRGIAFSEILRRPDYPCSEATKPPTGLGKVIDF
jgi:hypothetical protein